MISETVCKIDNLSIRYSSYVYYFSNILSFPIIKAIFQEPLNHKKSIGKSRADKQRHLPVITWNENVNQSVHKNVIEKHI